MDFSKLKQVLAIVALTFIGTLSAFGQGIRKDDIALGPTGTPLPNAQITICTSIATGVPCSPQVNVYSDVALTHLLTQPLSASPNGNYGFYIAPGTYVYTIQATGLVPYTGVYQLLGGTTTICSGTIALPTALIASGAKSTLTTATCTGLLSTDNILMDFSSDPSGVTGYAPSANGTLTIVKFPTTNTINLYIYNDTASGVTPGAMTVNYRVVR